MIKLPLSGVAVVVGGLAMTLTAGVGVASASPDLDPMINTTCTYDQWVHALHDENPGPASAFDSQPASQSFMQQFIASPPAQRASMAQMVSGMPGAEQSLPVIRQAFSTCNRY
jgi:hemophore-related protein